MKSVQVYQVKHEKLPRKPRDSRLWIHNYFYTYIYFDAVSLFFYSFLSTWFYNFYFFFNSNNYSI